MTTKDASPTETMPVTNPIRYLVLAGLCVASCISGHAADLPYGHQDFVPTPEKPIYFRAGNGEYPGATPPTEWWEGTPVQRDAKDKNGKVTKVWDCADDKAKNILWKVPVPGWSLSHPIVVGKKVFAVGEPDFVTCWDFDTGKQLWQRRIMPLLLDGLAEEKAAAGQKVLDLARALFYVSSSGPTAGQQPDNLFSAGLTREGQPVEPDGQAFLAKKRAMAGKLAKIIATHRPEVEAFADADLLKAVDEDWAILKRFETAKELAELLGLLKDRKQRSVNLVTACGRKLGVDIGGCWWGYVGSADSTLASDGQRIYGVFDQGQIFCCDLDGKLLWGHREKAGEKGRHDNRGSFHRSPLLCGDLLLVRSMLHKGADRPVRALDTRTGGVRWETAVAGSNYTVPRLTRLPGTDGNPMDVLIGDAPEDKAKNLGLPILRVSDGKVIGHTPWHDCGRGTVMGTQDDMVIWSSTSDTGGGPSCSYRLKAVGADAVSAEKVYVLGEDDKKARIFYNQAGFPTMLGSVWVYGNNVFDAASGRKLSTVSAARFSDYDGMVIAGRYLIASTGDSRPWDRNRDDHKTVVTFVVVDLGDPANPKVVARNNLLGYADPPADLIVTTYLKDFDPYAFAGCYKGTASYFSMMGGPVPHGTRLFIQSSAYLYCIGER